MKLKITGLRKSMNPLFIYALGTKKFIQKSIRKGVSLEIDESQRTFHLDRLEARKIVAVSVIPEAPKPVKAPKAVKKAASIVVPVKDLATKPATVKTKSKYTKSKKSSSEKPLEATSEKDTNGTL